MFGADLRKAFRGAVATAWGADPFARGAYSAARPGAASSRAALGEPLADRLIFAGEATGGVWASQIAGAWRSGEAAARTVQGWL